MEARTSAAHPRLRAQSSTKYDRYLFADANRRRGCLLYTSPILVTAGQLKPLGNPPPGAVKFFLTAEIEQKKGDARWMNKATELIRLKVKDKNERAAKSRTLKGSVSATNGNATNGNNSHDRHS